MSVSDNDHAAFLASGEELNFDYNVSVCNESEKVTVHKITSDKFFEENKNEYSFIYIDSCHIPSFIKRDMENAFAVLKPGCIMWMDDYLGGDGKSIRLPMDEFIKSHKSEIIVVHMGYQLAIAKRKI
jgi:hypothetical protein